MDYRLPKLELLKVEALISYKQKNKEGNKISIDLETSDFVNNDNHPSLLL